MRLKVSTSVGPPEIGQWYARGEKGQEFRVVGRDADSRAIEIQTFDGELEEIDAQTWGTLPLERIETPEDWTAPLDNVEIDDLGYSETDMTAGDWTQPLRPIAVTAEAWEAPEAEEERDALGEGVLAEPLVADLEGAPAEPVVAEVDEASEPTE